MKILSNNTVTGGFKYSGLLLSLLVLGSCASALNGPEGSAEVRNKLTMLKNDPNLAEQARTEIREAEEAVRIAEKPLSESDAELGEHRVYIADRKVAIAQAKATTRYAEVERAQLSEEQDAARLQSRTREANQARSDAKAAQRSRDQAVTLSAQQAEEYQRQIAILQAKPTDRGLVLTLGDVLFATGSAELQGGANSNLNKLVVFLKQYPERNVQIEGHTDNVGGARVNQMLSTQRAESVQNYLTEQDIASQRISAKGLSMSQPIASNNSIAGRQQNRRVEIIIDEPL